MFNRAVLIYKPVRECLTMVKSALNTLRGANIEVDVVSVDDISSRSEDSLYYDLIVPVGGDGTFFRSVHTFIKDENQLVYPYPCGRRNFYYERPEFPIEKALELVLKGEYSVELIPLYRLLYDSRYFSFINDAVIVSANLGKTGRYVVEIASSPFMSRYTLESDGLVIGTAHGSSGHNLSAGGPLIIPQLDVLVITHLNPMSLGFPSIVVPGSSRIVVELYGVFNLYADGIFLMTLERGGRIEVARDQMYVRVARVGSLRDFVNIVIRQRGYLGS